MEKSNYLSAKGKSRRGKQVQPDETMKPEFDFSVAERAKFYRPNADFRFPIYLEPDVDEFLSILAKRRNMDVQELANRLLRADRDIIQNA
jgi:hypothetical protein